MRILQLVDSLEAGGTERMAVNLANGLASKVEFSGLCSTRAEGPLKNQLKANVTYLYLKKKSRFDFSAWYRCYAFLKQNKINILHAHSSSYGLAIAMKIVAPHLQVLWHDHYGKSDYLNDRPLVPLKILSKFFSGSIAVNSKLETWHKHVLKLSKVMLLTNFVYSLDKNSSKTTLYGANGKRIICLANWRPQKDIINLLEAFEQLYRQFPEWSLHLIGKRFEDKYQEEVLSKIESMLSREAIYVYGSVSDVPYVLSQANIGVLSSNSEGLPLSLLEYGMAKLPVVVTDVGDCNKVVSNGNNGFLVKPQDHKDLCEALSYLVNDYEKAKTLGEGLYLTIKTRFSDKSSFSKLISFYRRL